MADTPEELTKEELALWSQEDDELEQADEAVTEEDDNEVDDESTEDVEQPNQDSEEPESEDEVVEEATDAEEEDKSDENDDKDSNETDTEDTEKSEEATKDVESKTVVEELRPVKANGGEIPVKSIDEVYQLASMGANYKKKMADIAPFRKAVSAMKENGVSEADLDLLIDAKKGNKEAIAKIVKDSGIDLLELEETKPDYVAPGYGQDVKTQEITDVIESIQNDTEYSMTERIIGTDWDDSSRDEIRQNPVIIEQLHQDVKSGMYAKVAPEALRLELLDNGRKPKIEYYKQAGATVIQQMQAEQPSTPQVQEPVKTTPKPENVQRKKAAAATKSKSTNQVTDEPDWENMSDAEYDTFYKEMTH